MENMLVTMVNSKMLTHCDESFWQGIDPSNQEHLKILAAKKVSVVLVVCSHFRRLMNADKKRQCFAVMTPDKRQALEELTQKLAKESGCILDEEEDEDQDEGADQDGDLDLGSAERDDQIVPEVAAQEACISGK